MGDREALRREVQNPPSATWANECVVVLISLGMVMAWGARHSLPGLSAVLGADRGMLLSCRRSQSPAAIRNPPGSLCWIDPNTAPWWELTVLPRVGAGLARAIVEFRERGVEVEERPVSSETAPRYAASDVRDAAPAARSRPPAYLHTSDLEAVPGIGPKTVRRIARYIRIEHAD